MDEEKVDIQEGEVIEETPIEEIEDPHKGLIGYDESPVKRLASLKQLLKLKISMDKTIFIDKVKILEASVDSYVFNSIIGNKELGLRDFIILGKENNELEDHTNIENPTIVTADDMCCIYTIVLTRSKKCLIGLYVNGYDYIEDAEMYTKLFKFIYYTKF